MINRKQSPPIKDAVEFEILLKPYELFHLDNGIPVYVVRSEEQETLQLEFVFPAGSWYETESLVASVYQLSHEERLQQTFCAGINEMAELRLPISTAPASTRMQHTLHCLTKHTGCAVTRIAGSDPRSGIPEEELSIFVQNMKQKLAVNLQKCEFVANRHIDKYLFGEFHPYGRSEQHGSI